MLHEILTSTISEESAAAWWLQRYTGRCDQIWRSGRINKLGTPLYDTNWLPAAAAIALVYRDMGKTTNEIARILGKSHHAVAYLLAKVEAAEEGRVLLLACGSIKKG